MKKTKWIYMFTAAIIAAAMASGCAGFKVAAEPADKAVAIIRPIGGSSVSGMVTFLQESDKVRVIVDIAGLTPGKHGFHIHEFGDGSAPDGSSLGTHFNPYNRIHAAPDADKRHMGDLGNINADKNGRAKMSFLDNRILLNGPDAIIGRSIVIKERADDFETQPGGNAGKRIAYGIIGRAIIEAE